jgi:two-component system response regulator YesN
MGAWSAMFKVLIADDETKVCQLIKNLVSWEELGLEVVACVNDGISALSAIEELKPDLVVTDIRMPGYDGINLIKLAKETNQQIEFIIISGYKHFDYAHNAIKFGVEDYLLKPLKKTEFINALQKIVAKFENRSQHSDENELIATRRHNDQQKIRLAFMVDILFRGDGYEKKRPIYIDAVNNEYHFTFNPGVFQVIVIKNDMGFEEDNKNVDQLLTNKSIEIIQKYLKPLCYELVLYCSGTGIYCILNYDETNKQTIRKSFKSIIDEIVSMNDLFQQLSTTIGASDMSEDINSLHESLSTAKLLINERITLGTNRLIDTGSLKASGKTPMNFLNDDAAKRLSDAIEALDAGAVKKWIAVLHESISQSDDVNGNLVIEIGNEVIDLFLFSLKKQKIEMKDKSKFLRAYNEKIFKCKSISEVFEMLSKEITQQLEEIILEKQHTDMKPIRLAKQFMQKNFNLPISLELVSHLIGFNPTYFSYYFKKETGMNFLEYLVEIRVTKSKELLIDTDKNIAEIAEAVGYMDLKHFSKLFKKYSGLTPSEYRKIYQ